MKLNFELYLSISAPTRTSKINFLRIMELLRVPLKGGYARRCSKGVEEEQTSYP